MYTELSHYLLFIAIFNAFMLVFLLRPLAGASPVAGSLLWQSVHAANELRLQFANQLQALKRAVRSARLRGQGRFFGQLLFDKATRTSRPSLNCARNCLRLSASLRQAASQRSDLPGKRREAVLGGAGFSGAIVPGKQHQNLFWTISVYFLIFTSSFFGTIGSYVCSDFSIYNILTNSTADVPLFYKISATWSNHEGSLLLWCWLLSLYTFLYCFYTRSTQFARFNSWTAYTHSIEADHSLTFRREAHRLLTGQAGLQAPLKRPGRPNCRPGRFSGSYGRPKAAWGRLLATEGCLRCKPAGLPLPTMAPPAVSGRPGQKAGLSGDYQKQATLVACEAGLTPPLGGYSQAKSKTTASRLLTQPPAIGWNLKLNWIILLTNRIHLFEQQRRITTIAAFTASLIILFFSTFLVYTSNPFLRTSVAGAVFGLAELNPILQDPVLAIHPPCIYAGYVASAIAFSLCLSSLNNESARKRRGDSCMHFSNRR